MKSKVILILGLAVSLWAQTAKPKVLVAIEPTEFKTALAKEIVAKLEKESLEVVLVEEHKKEIEKHSAANYDAVFISNSGVSSKVRPWIAKWIENNSEHKDKIILHTTKTRDWTEQVTGVDMVSSASKKSDVSLFTKEYVALILKKTASEKTE